MPKTITAFDTASNETIILHLDGNPTSDEIRKAVYDEIIEFEEGDNVESMSVKDIEQLYDTFGIYICSVFDGFHDDEPLTYCEPEVEDDDESDGPYEHEDSEEATTK
jgi:hypothetical protein